MYRRFLTLLLLLTLLLTQWANGSRCMGGCRAAGQDSRPHVHFNAVLSGTPEVKGCGCQRQRQADVTDDSRLASASFVTDSPAATEQKPGHGSDDNILYLSFDSAVGGRMSAGCIGIAVSDDQVRHQAGLCAIPHGIDNLSSNLVSSCAVTPRPDERCPLYVRICSLLI